MERKEKAMIFQIQQRIFSLGDTYDILDEQGQAVFQVKSHLLSIGHSLDLLDSSGAQVAHIQQRVLSFHPEYHITRGGQDVVIVKKKLFTLFHDRFTIEGAAGAFEMTGDWLNWNYAITQNGQPVAQIGKQFAMFHDRYGVEIAEGADVPTILCLVIVMDEVAHPDSSD
jgi:uncharacterized protein YxjI